MIKIINNFNCKIVFSKTYGRLFKLPFQSMISYGSSKAVYYKNNYEINCMNGLNLDLVDSKTVSQSIKSIFDRYECSLSTHGKQRYIFRICYAYKTA